MRGQEYDSRTSAEVWHVNDVSDITVSHLSSLQLIVVTAKTLVCG